MADTDSQLEDLTQAAVRKRCSSAGPCVDCVREAVRKAFELGQDTPRSQRA